MSSFTITGHFDMTRIRDAQASEDSQTRLLHDPLTPTEWQRRYRAKHPDYVQREQQQWADKHALTRVVKPFASVDGEGAPGRRDRSYVLLRAGDHALTAKDGRGLYWYECLDWLCHLPKDKEYVAFAFDYDVTTILCGYSSYDRGWKALKRLTEQTIDSPVIFFSGNIGWWVWYRPKMEFKVAPARRCRRSPSGWCSTTKKCPKCGREANESRGHMIRISDTIRLFQSTLVKVIDDWRPGTAEERRLIGIGKDKREEVVFTDPDEQAEVIEYNRLETKLHADVMEQFREAWLSAGLPQPRNWQSPGSLAKIIFQHYRVPRRHEIDSLGNVPSDVWDIAPLAMYGGWFEVSMFGPIPDRKQSMYSITQHRYVTTFRRDITEYDLTSAYPYAMRKLLCLRHSHWEHRSPRKGEYALQLINARYTRPVAESLTGDDRPDQVKTYCPDVQKDDAYPVFMGLPHRDHKGRVSRPLHTVGWYWNFEIAEARHQEITVRDSWTWVADGCNCNMWGFIPELFALRQRLGKLRGKPIKLAINSLYGVTAERQRGDVEPPYTNLIVASFITAQTRTRIMHTIHKYSCEQNLRCGSNVVMIATDAVFFTGDPNLPAKDKESAELGDWTRESFPDGLFIVQGGIYWPPGATQAHSKTRGVPVSILHEHLQDFETAYRRMMATRDLNDGTVTLRYRRTPNGERVEAKRFVGLREAIHRNARQELGRFIPFTRHLGFDWSSKRAPLGGPPDGTGPMTTLPKTVADPVSMPYLPVQFAGAYIPEYMSEEAKLDSINDSPEWLTVVKSPSEDPAFEMGWNDSYRHEYYNE